MLLYHVDSMMNEAIKVQEDLCEQIIRLPAVALRYNLLELTEGVIRGKFVLLLGWISSLFPPSNCWEFF